MVRFKQAGGKYMGIVVEVDDTGTYLEVKDAADCIWSVSFGTTELVTEVKGKDVYRALLAGAKLDIEDGIANPYSMSDRGYIVNKSHVSCCEWLGRMFSNDKRFKVHRELDTTVTLANGKTIELSEESYNKLVEAVE